MPAAADHARQRLHRAVGIARAAELLATTGNMSDGTRLALDVEPLLNEASRLVDAASLMNRMSEEATTPN